MEYMPDTGYRVAGLLYATGLGFLLGLIYDTVKIIFLIFTGNDKKCLIARDIIYSFVVLLCTFLFLLVMCSGEMAFYAFIGEIAGCYIYFFSFGCIVYPGLKKKVKKIRAVIISILCQIRKILFFSSENIKKAIKNMQIYEKKH